MGRVCAQPGERCPGPRPEPVGCVSVPSASRALDPSPRPAAPRMRRDRRHASPEPSQQEYRNAKLRHGRNVHVVYIRLRTDPVSLVITQVQTTAGGCVRSPGRGTERQGFVHRAQASSGCCWGLKPVPPFWRAGPSQAKPCYSLAPDPTSSRRGAPAVRAHGPPHGACPQSLGTPRLLVPGPIRNRWYVPVVGCGPAGQWTLEAPLSHTRVLVWVLLRGAKLQGRLPRPRPGLPLGNPGAQKKPPEAAVSVRGRRGADFFKSMPFQSLSLFTKYLTPF